MRGTLGHESVALGLGWANAFSSLNVEERCSAESGIGSIPAQSHWLIGFRCSHLEKPSIGRHHVIGLVEVCGVGAGVLFPVGVGEHDCQVGGTEGIQLLEVVLVVGVTALWKLAEYSGGISEISLGGDQAGVPGRR